MLIDLLGFTVILPLFPSLFEYYETTSGDGLYLTIKTAIENFRSWLLIPPSEPVTSVLFGGLIGSLFSFLQFINSPILGALSGKLFYILWRHKWWPHIIWQVDYNRAYSRSLRPSSSHYFIAAWICFCMLNLGKCIYFRYFSHCQNYCRTIGGQHFNMPGSFGRFQRR